MQPGDDAIPEAKVAFRGLLRRKRLAMTSEVAKLLAMTRGVHSVLNFTIFFPWMKKNLISTFCLIKEMGHCIRVLQAIW